MYSRASAADDRADCRFGSSFADVAIRNSMPANATGTPTGVIVNMPITGIDGSVFWASIISPCSTRLVLVPMSVHTPPSTAA